MEGHQKLKGRNFSQAALNGSDDGMDLANNQQYSTNPNDGSSLNTSGKSIPVSPSLKLKIKLPGRNASNSAENVNFTFNNNGMIGTGKESQDSQRLSDSSEVATNPLKIVIKKTDYNPTTSPLMQSGSNQASRPIVINFIPFPKLNEHPVLHKSLSSTKEDGNLAEWSSTDLSSLKDELEDMRHSLRKFTSKLQEQLDLFEDWKNPNRSRDNIRKSGSFATSNHKKQKTNGEFGAKDDEEYLDEPMDDIDVIDEDPYAFDDKPKKNKLKAKNAKAAPRNKFHQSGTTAQLPPTTATPPNQKIGKVRENGPAARAGARNKNRNKKNDEYDSDDLGTVGKGGKHQFWNDMEPYFAPFTEADLKFITPVNIETDEAIVQIPPLGRYYREVWAEEDNEDPERFAKIASEISEELETDKPVACGDLTARLLSALIEENIVPSSFESQGKDKDPQMNKENGVVEDPKFVSNLGNSQNLKEQASGDFAFPLETPPTYDYSYTGMVTLEERIKLELRSIGLLDDEDLEISNSREDDEICSDLRKLQKQLREQVTHNNTFKTRLYNALPAIMQKEKQEKEDRNNSANLEQSYKKLMSKKKKTKKAVP